MIRPFADCQKVHIRSLSAESEVLDEVKKRTNGGEKFKDVIGEYVDRDELDCSPQAHWFNTSDFEKKGLDALVPWSKLKGKIVSTTPRGTSHVWVMMIDDYTPNTRITFEDALKSGKEQHLKLVIEKVRGGKYINTKARLLKEQKAKMLVFMDSEKKIYQKLADGYENWWKEIFKDTPNFEGRLKNYQDSKARWLQRHERTRNN